MKNKIRGVMVIVYLAVIVTISWPYVQNNILLGKFASQLYVIPLPPNTIQLSKYKSVGNLYGTGNHLDFLAVLEIESALSETELMQYYSANLIKPANEICFIKPGERYPEPIDANRDRVVSIDVIPKSQAEYEHNGSNVFYKADSVNHNIGLNLFIIQIKDTHYAPGWDLRAH
ncbi:MAG: hypothetical protein M0R40_09080 [Firmicutes bacterium]|nr:hypothetical protein [Bacillota bacterium]